MLEVDKTKKSQHSSVLLSQTLDNIPCDDEELEKVMMKSRIAKPGMDLMLRPTMGQDEMQK
jgi:hypothetical protein